MAFDPTFGGDPERPWCRSCKLPIQKGQQSVHVRFQTEPLGDRGFTGTYHRACGRPFQSLARVINLNPWRGF